MATENLGGISYSIDVDTSKMIDAQRDVDRELKRTARSVDDFKSSLKPIAGAMAAAFATMAITGFISKIIQVQREFDKLNSMLQTAAGSPDGAAAAFEALQEFAAKTPYDLAQVTKAFTQLVNLGLTPSERALASYGNTAAAMGKDLGQLVEAVADAVTGEFERLKEFGIKTKSEGDKVSFTFQGVTTTVKNSASEIESYLMALGENQFGGAMALQAQTLDGAISNLADSWDGLFRTISESGLGDAIEDTVRVAVQVIDVLIGTIQDSAIELSKADKVAEDIRRADNISEWAKSSTEFMAKLADMADVVWQTLSVLGRNVAFVFNGIGTEIGGIAAQINAVARGEFAQAKAIGEMMKADAAANRAALDKADADTLKARMSWGDKIRQQSTKNSKEVFGDRLAGFKVGGGGSSSGASKKKGKSGKSEEQKAAEDWAKWKDKQRADDIEADKRYRKEQAELADQEVRDQLKREEEKARAQYEVSQQIGGITAIDAQFEAKAQALQEYLNNELITQEQHDLAMIALAQETSDKVSSIRDNEKEKQAATQQQMVGLYGQMFGSMADLAKTFGDKQSGIYKGLFAVSKAFSIAEAALALQTNIAKAASLGFPANIGAISAAVGQGATIMGALKGINYGGGRQYGGGVSAGSLYRVNETGQPEMFTASNGKQYMMPTANGNVTPANQLGGGGGVQIIINNNMAGADVQATASPDGRIVEIAVNKAISEISAQFRQNSGTAWSALKSSSNINGRTV